MKNKNQMKNEEKCVSMNDLADRQELQKAYKKGVQGQIDKKKETWDSLVESNPELDARGHDPTS